ncbi:MAG: YdcF family protein [Chloroflexota bacterium]
MPKQKPSRSGILGRIILISIMVWFGVLASLIGAIHHTGTVDDVDSADAIVVLGAGLSRNGQPGYALTRRSSHAAELYHQGLADTIVCTGGIAEGQTRSEADGCRQVLLWHDVPASAILLEEGSASTEENALYAKPILEVNNLNSVIIVSDSYHVFRARYIFQTVGIDDVSLSPVSRHLIRGYPTYRTSVVREVIALHWQVFKTIFNIPITNL